MKLKPFLIFFIIFTLIYIALIISTGPFLMTWGQKRIFFETIYAKFLSSPLRADKMLVLVLVNSLFWSLIFYFAIMGIKLIKRK